MLDCLYYFNSGLMKILVPSILASCLSCLLRRNFLCRKFPFSFWARLYQRMISAPSLCQAKLGWVLSFSFLNGRSIQCRFYIRFLCWLGKILKSIVIETLWGGKPVFGIINQHSSQQIKTICFDFIPTCRTKAYSFASFEFYYHVWGLSYINIEKLPFETI